MTDEQITLNASQYCDTMNDKNEDIRLVRFASYIVGATTTKDIIEKENEWNSTKESKYPNDFEHVLGCYIWKYKDKIEYNYYNVYSWEDKYYDVDGSRRFWKTIDGDDADEPDYWKRENPPEIKEE